MHTGHQRYGTPRQDTGAMMARGALWLTAAIAVATLASPCLGQMVTGKDMEDFGKALPPFPAYADAESKPPCCLRLPRPWRTAKGP
jgi:hypothetical protein